MKRSDWVEFSTQAEDDASFGEVVGRHFHFHTIAYDQSDEAFAHFT